MKVRGGCHCGAVKFEAEVPGPPVPALDCNCSICRMTGYLHVMVPHPQFELITGRGELSSTASERALPSISFAAIVGPRAFTSRARTRRRGASTHAASRNRSSLKSRSSTGVIGSRPRPGSTHGISAVTAPLMHRPLRLTIDRSAIQANWRWLQDHAGVAAGAAVKADGYGLGARETVEALFEAGCRDFFVSSWAEAEQLANLPEAASLVVLHGVGPDDVQSINRLSARPCLNSAQQVARWKEIAPGRPCDVMIDTGINRLGLHPTQIGELDGLAIDTLHSHLACADEDSALNSMQLERFAQLPVRFRLTDTRWPTAPESASATITASTSFGRVSRSMAESNARRPRATSVRPPELKLRSSSGEKFPRARRAATAPPSTRMRTLKPRSSTLVMPMATFAGFLIAWVGICR